MDIITIHEKRFRCEIRFEIQDYYNEAVHCPEYRENKHILQD